MTEAHLPAVSFLPADASPFGVRTLDLRPITLGMLSTTRDPDAAARAASWPAARPDALDLHPPDEARRHRCSLRYAVSKPFGDGFLFVPQQMEEKWVLLCRGAHVYAIRSWSGVTGALAHGAFVEDALVLHDVDVAEGAFGGLGDAVALFDWLMRTHALGEVLPVPCERLDALWQTPLSFMSVFGCRAQFATEGWDAPASTATLRAHGAVVQAVRADDAAAVRALAASGHSLDQPTPVQGYGALHMAAIRKDAAMLRLLLELGANPDVRNDRGMDPLGCVIVHGGGIELMEALASAGADLHKANIDGFGLLHAAAEVGRADAIEWLVARGLDLERRTHRGVTPLHVACGRGHLNAVRALVAAGAVPRADSPFGTPHQIAQSEGHVEIVAALDEILR